MGCLVVLLFYLILFQRGLQVAEHSRCAFGRLLAAGLTAVLATQTFLNVAGVTKLIPLTGVTLPLISQGGASLLATFAGLGLLLAISDGAPASPARQRKGSPGGKATTAVSMPAPKRRRSPRQPGAKGRN